MNTITNSITNSIKNVSKSLDTLKKLKTSKIPTADFEQIIFKEMMEIEHNIRSVIKDLEDGEITASKNFIKRVNHAREEFNKLVDKFVTIIENIKLARLLKEFE